VTVQAGRIQFFPEKPKFVLTRGAGFRNLLRSTQRPANFGVHLVGCHAWMEGRQLHLPIRVVEVEKRHIRDHHLWSTAFRAQPAA